MLPKEKASNKKISNLIVTWLLLAVIPVFIVSLMLSDMMIRTGSVIRTSDMLVQSVNDVGDDVRYLSDMNLLSVVESIVEKEDVVVMNSVYLSLLASSKEYAEVNVIDENGIITASSNPDFIGFDMASGEQSRNFLRLIDDGDEYVQEFGPISYDSDIKMKYAGKALKKGGFLQVGVNEEQYNAQIAVLASELVIHRHIGQSGYMLVCMPDGKIISSIGMKYDNDNIKNAGIDLSRIIDDTSGQFKMKRMEVYGQPCYVTASLVENVYILGIYPTAEAFASRISSAFASVFIQVIVFVTLFLILFRLLKKHIVKSLVDVNRSLNEIAAGDLSGKVDVRSSKEFAELSDDINTTVDTLKHYIAEANSRIERELRLARSIQHSALPNLFPPFPGRDDFDIFADMYTAREVGGDFYDFYLLNDHTLMILIADVSGKGIPAALFMMRAKTLIKGHAVSGIPLEEVIERSSNELCRNNDNDMFVTAWVGLIDLTSGNVEYINAGHNAPLIKRSEGGYSYLEQKRNLVLAAFPELRYQKGSLRLEEGDRLFLYTDGATEAVDRDENMYGEERLNKILDSTGNADSRSVCAAVKEDIDSFVGSVDQFDDITMLAFHFKKRYLKQGDAR